MYRRSCLVEAVLGAATPAHAATWGNDRHGGVNQRTSRVLAVMVEGLYRQGTLNYLLSSMNNYCSSSLVGPAQLARSIRSKQSRPKPSCSELNMHSRDRASRGIIMHLQTPSRVHPLSTLVRRIHNLTPTQITRPSLPRRARRRPRQRRNTVPRHPLQCLLRHHLHIVRHRHHDILIAAPSEIIRLHLLRVPLDDVRVLATL